MTGWQAWVGFAAGLAVHLGTSVSVLHTVAGPRGRSSRLAAILGRGTERLGRAVARRLHSAVLADRVLALIAPVAFLVVLIAWLACYLLAFTLMALPVTPDAGSSARFAGSSLFTLGYAAPGNAGATVLSFVAAGTGLIVVTMELAYLPSLYAAYNRRETHVTLLAARCGDRLAGDRLLQMHLDARWLPGLVELYRLWEQWAADIRETHANYPILVSFRASEPTAAWPWALLALLDAASLHRALQPQDHPPEADAVLHIAVSTVRALAPRPAGPPRAPHRRVPGRWETAVAPTLDLDGVTAAFVAAGQPVDPDRDRVAARLQADRDRYLPALTSLASALLLHPFAGSAADRPTAGIQPARHHPGMPLPR